MRYVIGSTVGIVAISSGPALGKALTDQVDWLLAAALVVGACPAPVSALRVAADVAHRLGVVLGLSDPGGRHPDVARHRESVGAGVVPPRGVCAAYGRSAAAAQAHA
jgi:hypothetical protein